MKVIKRDCSEVDFDKNKIEQAILKAMKNGSGVIKQDIAKKISDEIEEELSKDKLDGFDEVSIFDIEDKVFDKLITKKQRLTAKAYEGYRQVREYQREVSNSTDKAINELLGGTSEYWNTENSNKNAKIVTTQRDYLAGITSEDIARRFLLTPEVVHAHDEGIIHFHDIDYFAQDALHNCDLINLEDMLQNGTVVNDVLIEKPHRLLTATTISTQIITAVTSSQYGGATITLTHLAPFVRDSYIYHVEKYKNRGFDYNTCIKYAKEDLAKEIKDSVQTFNYQISSMSTTNGQSPFLSVFMYLGETEEYKEELAMLIEEFLKQRMVGFKNEKGVYITPAFPKLLYTLEEDNIHESSKYWYLTVLAAKCTAKRLVPDYMSEKKMKELKQGDMYPVMGCVDGKEIITYKYMGRLYVEAFERMWHRLSDYFEVKHQCADDNPNLYMDLTNVKIYDTEKGFVDTKRIVRNISDKWIDVNFSNGRRLLCTEDHPFATNNRGRILANELELGDSILINSNQYTEENMVIENDKAWLMGFMLCDGCYQNNHLFSSIAASEEDDIATKFISSMKKYFNLNTEVILQERGARGTYKDLYVRANNENGIAKATTYFFTKYQGKNKNDRQVPNEVFEWNYEAKLSFLAGMIDADGYVNPTSHGGSIIQIGSTNKELALQQLALAQSLGMPARLYHNHYSSRNPELIRHRVEFFPIEELIQYLQCEKKKEKFIEATGNHYNTKSEVTKLTYIDKTMYSYDVTTESDHFEVSGIYSHNCRSALTVYHDEKGNSKYYGRFNQGVVTLNLVDVALSSDKDADKFWELMDERTELCHRALQIRHEKLTDTVSDVAPILWQHGALARLKSGETINKLLHGGYSTLSLGYAGLYECVKYITGDSHTSENGKEFGLRVMQYMNDKCNKWKFEENIDYSIYGSPIESTTYKFAKCLKKRFGESKGITDKSYITNSYHVPVFEEIDAFTKLKLESEFQALSPGGAISYIESANISNNIDVALEVIKFIYDNIMYAEINTKSDYCMACGYDGEILINEDMEWYCPNCGNKDHSKMNVARRTCGYIGSNFWNFGRTQEIKERFVHLDNHDFKGGCK